MALLLVVPLLAVAGSAVDEQRQWFMEARDALEQKNLDQFNLLRKKLQNYPLTPYLDIWQARNKLKQGQDVDLPELLNRHADIPGVADLQLVRIRNLAERGQWPHVAIALKEIHDAGHRLPEISMLSLWYTGKKDEALNHFSRWWEQGNDVSDLAMRIEQEWQEQGHPSGHELWKRLGKFARKGHWEKVRKLEHLLPEQDRKWIGRWQSLQQNPLAVLKQWTLGKRLHFTAEMMLDDGLQRLSRVDAISAWNQLQRLKSQFKKKKFNYLEQRIALRAASQHSLLAIKWLAGLADDMQTRETRAWHIRLNILYGNWLEAIQAMQRLPESEQRQSRWGYWQARALETLGKEKEAKNLYQHTAQGRGYYSFLSAEKVGAAYKFGVSKLDSDISLKRKLERKYNIIRAHEWLKLGEETRAKAEWDMALRNASSKEWKAAVDLASDWQWHDQVIYSVVRAGAINALKQRFPMGYEQQVAKIAQDSQISESLIWSVIRQESAFNTNAVSKSGARGLMQLKPSTADDVVRRSRLIKSKPDLFDPSVNIQLGGHYLGWLLKKYDHNYAIATAAYNAGPGRVSGWLENRPFGDADIWIETIPFEETRRYVQQVMAFTVVYEWLQAKTPVGIIARINLPDGEG